MDSGENILNSWNKGNVKISESYIGLNDGDSIKTLVSHYNIADVIVDISANSKTAISLLEGMACGCIPVGVVGGRAGEIISQMPCEFQFFVDSNEFYWTDNEVLQIPSKESLQKILVKLQNIKENDFERFVKISRISREIAEKYTTSKFIEGIERVLLKTPLREQSVLCVENLTNA
jgi:glycosyltransferase involved in cell wall biosynthesis